MFYTARDRGSCAGDPALLFDFFRQCDRAPRRHYALEKMPTAPDSCYNRSTWSKTRCMRARLIPPKSGDPSSRARRVAGACVGAILTPAGPNRSAPWTLRHMKDHKAYTRAADRYPAIERLIARHPDFNATKFKLDKTTGARPSLQA